LSLSAVNLICTLLNLYCISRIGSLINLISLKNPIEIPIGFTIIYFISLIAYNGNLTSSLASPILSKPVDTFEEIVKEEKSLNILLRNDSFQVEYMQRGISKNLRKIYERSVETGKVQHRKVKMQIQIKINIKN
jgi:hypothetical protein